LVNTLTDTLVSIRIALVGLLAALVSASTGQPEIRIRRRRAFAHIVAILVIIIVILVVLLILSIW
jgi:t-SNARE complex subunit (syntaxin)